MLYLNLYKQISTIAGNQDTEHNQVTVKRKTQIQLRTEKMKL